MFSGFFSDRVVSLSISLGNTMTKRNIYYYYCRIKLLEWNFCYRALLLAFTLCIALGGYLAISYTTGISIPVIDRGINAYSSFSSTVIKNVKMCIFEKDSDEKHHLTDGITNMAPLTRMRMYSK